MMMRRKNLDDYVWKNDKAYRVLGKNDTLRVSQTPSSSVNFTAFHHGLYVPETMDELHELHAYNAGLIFCFGSLLSHWRAVPIGSLVCLVLMNYTLVDGEPGNAFFRYQTKRTKPDVYFGFLFLDGGKWSNTRAVRQQFAYEVIIPPAWLPELEQCYGVDENQTRPSLTRFRS